MSDLAVFIATVVLFAGLSTTLWGCVGGLRWVLGRTHPLPIRESRIRPGQVGVLIAAHNEETVIEDTITAVSRLVPAGQVFVASDASTDRTAEIVRSCGANVVELVTSHGKAGALVAGLRHFGLTRRFAVIMILDADTVPSDDYLYSGLPLFDDPAVAAVAGRASTRWPGGAGWMTRVLVAHRERLYVLFQTLLKYGQAARGLDAVAIVPGFASMYRADVLDTVDIAAPGLAIEDYNMTFEIHAKSLGRIAFQPWSARAYTQDPATLTDYVRQVGRWNLGFWQTLRRHRPRARVFWASVTVFAVEVVLSSVLVLALAATAIALAFGRLIRVDEWSALSFPFGDVVVAAVTGIVVVDLIATTYVAMLTRRASIIVFAPAYTALRVLDAALCLRALVHALTRRSSGVWRSPERRIEGQAA
ncbi:glycosyltransferase [Aeromicrobium sp. YIM 150415]|uniref:glycosyltransferase family 2 protein n=1 Tax=Aeromicrobium sp. YIM 150415 TaxID=2803912 RepID=UPI001966AF69|nr:glycosyltransferase family 2 protein [Aeromicrobium sp. YIM 150415]MBM9465136.1 glycosyltransferase [Aeromicrobium sp. YIM 150415]